MESTNYIIERLDSLDSKFDEKLDKILIQTTKTNGRVNGHDQAIEKLEKQVELLREVKDINKGRDKVIYIVLGAMGMAALSLAAIYLKK